MIKIIAGEKGQGKTKQLIHLANDALKQTDGYVVFIDDDRRHMYDLHRDIRFVETSSFPLSNYRELVGFIYGILSQNNDIRQIFIDGIGNIVKTFDNEALIKLVAKLNKISESNEVDFIVTINCTSEELPAEAKQLLYA